MDNLTKALLKDLQNDLNTVKKSSSNIETVWQLNKFIDAIKLTQKLITNNIKD